MHANIVKCYINEAGKDIDKMLAKIKPDIAYTPPGPGRGRKRKFDDDFVAKKGTRHSTLPSAHGIGDDECFGWAYNLGSVHEQSTRTQWKTSVHNPCSSNERKSAGQIQEGHLEGGAWLRWD